MAAGLSMSTISEVHRSAVTSSSSTPSSPTSNRPSQPPPPPPIMELTPSTLTRLTSAVTAPPPPTPPTSTTPSATTSSSSSLHTTSPSAPDTTGNNHPIDFASGAAPAAAVSSDAASTRNTSCSAVGHTPGSVATTAAAATTAPPAQVIVLTSSSGGSSTCAVPSLANHREAGTAAAACSLPLSPPSPHTKSPSVAVKHLSKLMVGLVNAAPLPATPPLGLIKQPPPLHINHHPFSHHGQDNAHMDTTEDTHKKRRCADRYDSSESSDSGVATLSCTDSSTASSDGSDPGSPYSPSSSSCDDPNQQPGTLPSVSITLSTTKPILTTQKTNLPHVWPWSNNFTTQVPQLSISTMTNPPPLAKSSKRTSMISSSDPMAASIKKIRTASTKPLALVAAAPKLKPMPALSTPITVSNPQTKITGFFKSQIKSVNTVKRDLTNLVVRSTEFPTKNHLDSFATHHNPYTHPANITAIACDPVDVRTAHITTVAPMQSQPAYKKVDRKTAKVAPLMVNSRKVSLTPSPAPKKKPQSIAPRILPAEPTKKPNEPQKSMLGNPTNVILGGFRVPPQQQMVAPMQYITSSISQQVTTHPPPPPVLMTSARTTKIALPVYHHPHNPPLVMPKLVQIPKDQQHTQANHRVNTSPNQQRPTQPHYFLNGALIKLQTLGPDMSNANLQTVANKPFVHQTNQPQYTTQPQLFMTTSSGLLLANGMPAVINSSPMTINTHAAMPALHPYSANTPTVLPNIATLIQNQMQTNFVQASTQSVQQHFNSHPSMHLQPNQMSLVVSHTPFDDPINHQSTINTKVIKPQIRITSSSHTPIQSNLITTFAPTNSLANGSKVVPRHTMSSPPPLISSNTPPPLCISKPFASSPAAARLLITISPVTSPTSISSPRTTRPLPSPSCLPMLTPIQSLPEVYVATSAPTSTPTTTPTTPTTLSPHIIPSCPPCLPSPKSLVLERIQRLKPDVCDEPSTSCSSPTSIDTDLLSVALPDCAKSPILSQPKTIRFPAAGSSRSGVRRSDGRLVGVCYWDGCEQKYDTSSKLLDHLQTQHVNTQSGPFACEWSGCKVHGRESCSRRWLERHVLSHGGTKQFKCIVDNCGLRFGSQLTLEKHVNSHFNTSETKDQAPRRVSDPLIPKKLRVHGKKLRYRRQPFSARMFDFFDNGIMEILQHRLTHTEVTVCGTRGSVVFTGTQIGKRVTGIGGIEHLVRWSPPEILPDEWLPESSALIVQSTLPASLDSYGSSGCSSSASSVSSASFTLNSSSTTSTSISKSVRIQTMAQAQRIALQRYLRVVYQNTSNHPPNVQYTEHLLATAAAPTVKKNRRKTTRKCTAS